LSLPVFFLVYTRGVVVLEDLFLILDEYVLIILYDAHAVSFYLLLVEVLLNSHGVVLVGLTLNLLQKFLLVSVELQVLEHLILVVLFFRFVKIVHVQLPNEGRVVIVFEVFGEHFFLQFSLVNDHEGVALWRPANDVLQVISFQNFEDFEKKSR
jgi:hypothetical protein